MPARPLTVLFMPESAYGPTNNCIGIGDVLRRRGHRVVFAAEASWKGKLEPLGFEEDLVDLAAARRGRARTPGSSGRTSSPRRRRSSASRRSSSWRPGSSRSGRSSPAAPGTASRSSATIIDRASPDVIVEDNVVGFPALVTAGVPFVRIVSCNPLEIKGPDVPPAFSGYPAADQAGWAEFRAEYDRMHRPLWQDFNAWYTAQGAPSLPDLEFIAEGDVNLYVYPEVADYRRESPLGPSWHRLDSSVRATDEDFTLPPALGRRRGADLLLARLARIGGHRADAAGDLLPGGHPAPLHRVQGPAARRDRAGAEHVGRRVRPADRRSSRWSTWSSRTAATTPRPRPSLRQADDRSAVVLGPVRQRATGGRARARRPARPLWLHRRPDARGAGPAARPTRALRERLASAGQAIRERDGVGRAAAIIEGAAGG